MVVNTYSCGAFGTSICYETAVCFKYKHSEGGTGDGCSVVLVVSPLVSLINYGSHRRVNTAATLQAVYLVWLFLRITTMCNLSIIGLLCDKFPESFAHAQTVDTRPLFPPPTWPGYGLNVIIPMQGEEHYRSLPYLLWYSFYTCGNLRPPGKFSCPIRGHQPAIPII